MYNKEGFDGFCEIKYLSISPYKLRKIAELIRNKNASYSLKYLKVLPQRGATLMFKALHSAFHNAINLNSDISIEDLYVDTVLVDEGKRLKRIQPRARGRAFSIIKRSSHIKIGLKVKSGVKHGTKG